MAFAEDLDPFLNDDEFAVAAVHGLTTKYVIFDNQFLGIPGEPVIASAQPMALGKTSDFSAAAAGQTIVISGTTYYITGVHPDGTGMTTLMLRK